jgi:hypothetical protein
MRLTLPASKLLAWFLLVCFARVGHPDMNPERTLDLAGIPKSERHSLGVPGSSIGGTSEGHVIAPDRYHLPLKAKIERTEKSDRAALRVWIELQNTGTVEAPPFQLSSCVDERKAHGPDQLGRRTFEFRFEFSGNDLKVPIGTTADVTFGAATVSECSIPVAAGNSALVILETEVPPQLRAAPARTSHVQINALLEELTLENNKFQVSRRSQEVRSDAVPLSF